MDSYIILTLEDDLYYFPLVSYLFPLAAPLNPFCAALDGRGASVGRLGVHVELGVVFGVLAWGAGFKVRN